MSKFLCLHLRSIPTFFPLFPPPPRRSSSFPVVTLVHLAWGGQFPSPIKFRQQQLMDVEPAMLEVAVPHPPSLSALGTWPVPGGAAHLWGKGRLNHHPMHTPGTPSCGFQLYSGGKGWDVQDYEFSETWLWWGCHQPSETTLLGMSSEPGSLADAQSHWGTCGRTAWGAG